MITNSSLKTLSLVDGSTAIMDEFGISEKPILGKRKLTGMKIIRRRSMLVSNLSDKLRKLKEFNNMTLKKIPKKFCTKYDV